MLLIKENYLAYRHQRRTAETEDDAVLHQAYLIGHLSVTCSLSTRSSGTLGGSNDSPFGPCLSAPKFF